MNNHACWITLDSRHHACSAYLFVNQTLRQALSIKITETHSDAMKQLFNTLMLPKRTSMTVLWPSDALQWGRLQLPPVQDRGMTERLLRSHLKNVRQDAATMWVGATYTIVPTGISCLYCLLPKETMQEWFKGSGAAMHKMTHVPACLACVPKNMAPDVLSCLVHANMLCITVGEAPVAVHLFDDALARERTTATVVAELQQATGLFWDGQVKTLLDDEPFIPDGQSVTALPGQLHPFQRYALQTTHPWRRYGLTALLVIGLPWLLLQGLQQYERTLDRQWHEIKQSGVEMAPNSSQPLRTSFGVLLEQCVAQLPENGSVQMQESRANAQQLTLRLHADTRGDALAYVQALDAAQLGMPFHINAYATTTEEAMQLDVVFLFHEGGE